MNFDRRKFLKFVLIGSGLFAVTRIFKVNWFANAWTEPSLAPPDANVATPINEGSTNQIKTGGLKIDGKLEATNRLKIPVGTDMFD
jgi:hypothetical protein